MAHLVDSSPDLSRGTRIDLDDLTKRYVVGESTVTALAGVNLHVDDAAFVVVLGPSGSGKTTLLNMIGLLDRPTEGRIRLSGRDVTGATRTEQFALRRRTVSFVFQTFNLFPGLTALENVQFGADVAGLEQPGAVARERLAQVGLATGVLHHREPVVDESAEDRQVSQLESLMVAQDCHEIPV